MFMVLSSWQSHCESSHGSSDECRTAPSGRRPKPSQTIQTASPPVQAARNYTHRRHLLLLLSPKADTHFTHTTLFTKAWQIQSIDISVRKENKYIIIYKQKINRSNLNYYKVENEIVTVCLTYSVHVPQCFDRHRYKFMLSDLT